jgi:small subunit ribosomal protein S1
MSTHVQTFADLIEQSTFISSRYGNLITGKIIDIGPEYVTVDAKLKSESLVPLAEFRNADGELTIQVGDDAEFMVENSDNGFGESCLSREKAIKAAVWRDLDNAFKDSTPIIGRITDRVKGGFTVDIHGIRAFLPGSQVDLRPVKDMQTIENKDLEFRIVKLDKKRNNVVVSRRAMIETESSEERTMLLDTISEGQEMKGVVKNLTDYGAFIDLGGVDGLLHITDMSWKRLKHPSEMIKVGDELTVRVLSYDKEKRRVSLGLKQLHGDPWYDVIKKHPVGSRLFGRVSSITEYGCFVEIAEGVEGLVHMSEMDWTNKNVHPSKVVENGQEIEVFVLEIDDARRRISLGIKQCQPNPWREFENNHEVDQKISGTIRSITDFGVFIGLEGNIDGLVHLNDLSWALPPEKAIRLFKKGQEVQAVILAIDPERERISLGIKQLEHDPFESFVAEHPRGSKVSGKVAEVDVRRIVLDLPKGLQGSIKRSDVEHEPQIGETIEAYITSSERKNTLVQLSTHPESVQTASAAVPRKTSSGSSQSGEKASATIGDLMREQLQKRDDNA